MATCFRTSGIAPEIMVNPDKVVFGLDVPHRGTSIRNMNMPSFFSQLRGSLIPRLAAVVLVALALGSGCASSANTYGSKINDATASGNLSKTKALLKANPDLVFSKDRYGYTPLHEAAFMGCKDEAELLLANGANVNATNNFGKTVLCFAENSEFRGSKDVAKLLRQRGGHE